EARRSAPLRRYCQTHCGPEVTCTPACSDFGSPFPRAVRRGVRPRRIVTKLKLLDRRGRALGLDLLLELLCVGLGNSFLDRLGSPFDQVLGLLQAQSRDLPDDL